MKSHHERFVGVRLSQTELDALDYLQRTVEPNKSISATIRFALRYAAAALKPKHQEQIRKEQGGTQTT